VTVSYRFADSARPGILLGLSGRQVVSLVAGVLWLAICLQAGLPVVVGGVGPLLAVVVAFGRWHGASLAEIAAPAVGLVIRRRTGRAQWVRASLLGAGPGYEHDLPGVLAGLDVVEVALSWLPGRTTGMAVVRDARAGTVTGVLRVHGRGFPLAALDEQDVFVARWGAALSPLAREQTPVARVVWQEWAYPAGTVDHEDFLAQSGFPDRAGPECDDYKTLLAAQGALSVCHEVLVSVVVDRRRVRGRAVEGRDAAVDVLVDEVRLVSGRLEAAGLRVDSPLSPPELSTGIRARSDPARSRHVGTLARSLAAATGRGAIEWGPMAVDADLGHVRVDGAWHRSFRVASWPMLRVTADWLGPLLVGVEATRTVTVVMVPVPMSRAARAADRRVMGLEADADVKERRGFRVNARDRKRLDDARAQERELAQGHATFRFAGLVDVTASSREALDVATARVVQAGAHALVDLRALDARHDLGWVASLPLGRTVAGGPGR
jgi:hypothetical protein